MTLVGQTVLDKYVVDDELGSGAMGTVYRGHHIKLPRQVAIKVLHPDLLHDPKAVARFHREAKGAAKLQHPNIVGVIDFGESGDDQVMVMELAPGEPLRATMDGAQPRERCVHLVREILKGLDHAHAHGIIHRDLKPENIIVEQLPDGSELPRLCDFGIAVLRDPETVAGGKLTATGQVLGTPIYMAPEQAQCEQFDERIDMFALGVILYELLSGTQPFDGSAMEIAVANITHDHPPIATRAGVKVDPLLEQFSRRLAAREQKKRIGSAREAMALLDLIESDRAAAGLALGIIDVARALALISLPSR